MLPSFNTGTYYHILAGNEDLKPSQGRLVGELADGSLRKATASKEVIWQLASEEVEHTASGRGSSVAVYVILNDRGTLRLYGCAPETSWEILPGPIVPRRRLRASALAA